MSLRPRGLPATASKHHPAAGRPAAWHALTCPCDDRDLDVARVLEGSRARREATHADARLNDLETAQLFRAVEMGFSVTSPPSVRE